MEEGKDGRMEEGKDGRMEEGKKGGYSLRITHYFHVSRFTHHVSRSVLPLFFMLVISSVAFAQESPLHGFAQANYSVRVASTQDAPAGMTAKDKDVILGEERLQLELSQFSQAGNASFSSKVDFVRDAIDSTMKIDLREAYLNLSLWKFDSRIGRQIITWGLGDLVFINDVFTKDWVAFLSGQPLQYLKVGSDALNISFHPGPVSGQVIVIPFFEPDHLPTGERLFFFDPLLVANQGPSFRKPKLKFKNFEVAGRVYKTVSQFDLSLYGYSGFSPSPAFLEPPSLARRKPVFFYPRLWVYGGSAQGATLGGIVSLEGGYYDFVDDRDGTNLFISNPQIRFLGSYQRAFGADLTVGLQYYGEAMRKYDEYEKSLPPGFPKANQIRHNITLRATQFLKYQTLRLSLFGWVSPNDEDYYINPEIRYSFTDELWGAIGGNIFGGSEAHTFLGQFEQNDNLYLTVRYGF